MSRRPKCDAPMEIQANSVAFAAAAASQPHCSNLLSNENVIAFAPGVVIDDGVASSPACTLDGGGSEGSVASESNHHLSARSLQPPPAGSDRVREAVNNCLRRQAGF